MSNFITEHNNCGFCHSPNVSLAMDLGVSPLANSYLDKDDLEKKEFKAPLQQMLCHDCGCFFLKHEVDKDILYKNYLYESSTTKSLQDYFKRFADTVVKDLDLRQNDLIVEGGSNDYISLKNFKEMGFRTLGIDPATNLAFKCNERGDETICDYFNEKVGKQIAQSHGRAKLVLLFNCMAHNYDIHEYIKAVKAVLDIDGYLVFENSYQLDIVKNKYFDVYYHEHFYSFSIKPLYQLFQSYGMTIFKVERTPSQGGSIRVFVSNNKSNYVPKEIKEIIDYEESCGIFNLETYKKLELDLQKTKIAIQKQLDQYKSEGKIIVAIGYPAKATTLCNYFQLHQIDFIIDEAKLKQNKFSPGFHKPIYGLDQWDRNNPNQVGLILAWNFASSIMNRFNDFKGKWVVPLQVKEFNSL